MEVTLTFMDTRFLMADLGVVIQPPASETAPAEPLEAPSLLDSTATGKVTMTVDEFPLPNTMVSGRVTFTDGENAGWYLNERGQLGLEPPFPGYQAPEADIAAFQEQLQLELQRAGY